MRHQPTTRQSVSGRAGLTLAEVVISTTLVTLLLVSSLRTVGGVVRTWDAAKDQNAGMELAMEMMMEVMQAQYVEPDDTPQFGREGSESGGDRTEWDDTDDYDGWSKSPPESKDGTTLSGYTGWTRAVDVKKVNAGKPNENRTDGSEDKGLRKITVTVTDPDGVQTVLVGTRAKTGVMEQRPATESTFVIYVDSELQIGASADAVRSGISITNHAKDE